MKRDKYFRLRLVSSRRRLKAVLIVVLGLIAAELTSETLTMTTWYPSPSGTYKTLRATMNAYFAYSGGSVGIGTTAPGQKLSVAGTIESTSGGIKFPDGTTQLTAASGGGVNGMASFNAAGNWIAPAGVTHVLVKMWGGGCGCSIDLNGDVGGPPGGYAEGVIAVTPQSVYSIVVGQAGPNMPYVGGNTSGTSSSVTGYGIVASGGRLTWNYGSSSFNGTVGSGSGGTINAVGNAYSYPGGPGSGCPGNGLASNGRVVLYY